MSTRRTHIVISDSLVTEIDRLVGKCGRSEFLTDAAEKELRRLQQIKALENVAGAPGGIKTILSSRRGLRIG